MGHLLLAMEMSQRHVGEMTGKHRGGHRITEDVSLPLSPALLGAVNREMAGEQVDGIGGHPGGEDVDQPFDPLFVDPGVLIGIGAHDLLGAHDAALGDEGKHGDLDPEIAVGHHPAPIRW